MESHEHASRSRRWHRVAPEGRWARWRSPWKQWLGGVLLVFINLCMATLLTQSGYFMAAVLWAVLCALPLGLLAMVAVGFDGMVGGISMCVACVIAIGGAVAGQGEVKVFGKTAHDVVAANANDDMDASFLHFRNARVLVERTGATDVYTSSGKGSGTHHSYTLRIAPIVDAGWAQGQPVAVFAVIGSPQFGHHASEWAKPRNGAIRLNGFDAHYREVAMQGLVRSGLHVVPNPLFVRWSADPEGEASAARKRLLMTLMIEIVAWSLLFALLQGWMIYRGRNRATRMRS